MKVKKRLFAGMLALAMLLSLNVTAFAQNEVAPSEKDTVYINKVYDVRDVNTGDTEAVAPGEELTFTVTPVSVTDSSITETKDMPVVTVGANKDGKVTYTNDNKAAIPVNLPEYSVVGLYTYTIAETSGQNAGVSYDNKAVTLNVLVTRNEEKNELEIQYGFKREGVTAKVGDDDASFINSYVTGDLEVTKNVTGALGDTNKYFKFAVTLHGVTGKKCAASYNISGTSGTGEYASSTTISVGTPATIWLKDGETAVIEDLPNGMSYTVVEDTDISEGYTTTIEVNSEQADNANNVVANFNEDLTIKGEKETVAFENNKGADNIDTGVYLDNLPYIIIFVGVLAAVAVLVIRRRRVDD